MAKNPTPPREPTDHRTEAEREAAYAAANQAPDKPQEPGPEQLAAALGAINVNAPMGKSEEAIKQEAAARLAAELEEQRKAADAENAEIAKQNQAIEQARRGRVGGLAGLQAAAAEGHEVAGQIAMEINTERAPASAIRAIRKMSNDDLGRLVRDIEDAKGDLSLEQFSVLDFLKSEFPSGGTLVSEKFIPDVT